MFEAWIVLPIMVTFALFFFLGFVACRAVSVERFFYAFIPIMLVMWGLDLLEYFLGVPLTVTIFEVMAFALSCGFYLGKTIERRKFRKQEKRGTLPILS